MSDNHICCICGDTWDKEKRPASDYAIHGKGKNKIINYFHKSCYYEELKNLRNEVYNDNNI